jgi:DNA-binding MurR/RpiR family transcriptional regulator
MLDKVSDNDRFPRTLQQLKKLIAQGEIQFPPQLERVVKRMLEEPDLIAFESAATVAKECSVSQTTVTRLSVHLGLRTFRNLKKLCEHHVRRRFNHL